MIFPEKIIANGSLIKSKSLSKPDDCRISCCTDPQVRTPLCLSFSAFQLLYSRLFYIEGTGKTSTVLALARRLYGPAYRKHILELNASDDRGIDVVREQIKNFAMTKVLFSYVLNSPSSGNAQTKKRNADERSGVYRKGFKLVILDEADMMTQAAQSALRRGWYLFLLSKLFFFETAFTET